MDRLAIEFISVFGMPPVQFVELAAKLGCPSIGIAPRPIVTLDGLYPAWDLAKDPALLAAVARALADNGVKIAQAEGFLVMPGLPVDSMAGDLDIVARLGARQINACVLAPDMAANVEGFGRLAELAGERGMAATVEFLPGMTVGNLAAALDLVAQTGRANAGVLVDSMHLFRSGSDAAELAAANPAQILYAQLCDVPVVSKFAEYADEARYERLAPGDGELPLASFIKALPANVTIGLEVPLRAAAEKGLAPETWIAPAIAKARALLG
jgi:sugar phosphate isomerase/epimerase